MILSNGKLAIIFEVVINGIRRIVPLQALKHKIGFGRCMGCGFSIGIDIDAIGNTKALAFGDITFPLIIRTSPAVIVDKPYSQNGEIDTIGFDLFPINSPIVLTDINAFSHNSLSRP